MSRECFKMGESRFKGSSKSCEIGPTSAHKLPHVPDANRVGLVILTRNTLRMPHKPYRIEKRQRCRINFTELKSVKVCPINFTELKSVTVCSTTHAKIEDLSHKYAQNSILNRTADANHMSSEPGANHMSGPWPIAPTGQRKPQPGYPAVRQPPRSEGRRKSHVRPMAHSTDWPAQATARRPGRETTTPWNPKVFLRIAPWRDAAQGALANTGLSLTITCHLSLSHRKTKENEG